MKLTPYKEALRMGKEKINEMLAPAKARKAKKKAELKIAELDEKIATLQSEIQECCSEEDVNFERIISKLDDLGLTERKQKQFVKIIEEMFPED